MAFSPEFISEAILRAWTSNQGAGLASLETCPDRDQMLSAQTMAIAQAVCDATRAAFTWHTETAILEESSTFTLTKAPEFDSLLVFIGGALLSPANWLLDGKVVTFVEPITGDILARYQTIETDYRVLLVEIGAQKLEVIKIVRALTGLGLADAKELVEAASPQTPQIILDGVNQSTAEDARAQLTAIGATVQVAER